MNRPEQADALLIPSPSGPLLTSFQVRNFRCFGTLDIPRLRPVNLIVGRNGVGKSTLLEAIRVYCTDASAPSLNDILYDREEFDFEGGEEDPNARPDVRLSLKNLFHGRAFPDGDAESDSIILTSGSSSLVLQYDLADASMAASARLPRQPELFTAKKADERPIAPSDFEYTTTIKVSRDKTLVKVLELRHGNTLRIIPIQGKASPQKCILVRAADSPVLEIANLWDRVVLTDGEAIILETVQLICPQIERITAVGTTTGWSSSRRPMGRPVTFIAKMRGGADPIPLRSLGEGTYRAFSLGAALANAADGVLLIDEIENGLHWRAQPEIWRAVFKVAQRHNIQIFATTHSFDCLRGFAKATEACPLTGALLRLETRDDTGEVKAVVYDEDEDIQAAAEQGVEVR